MHRDPDFFQNLRSELSNGRVWLERAIVLAYAVAAGLFVVGFTLLSEWTFEHFEWLFHHYKWAVLLWTPLITVVVVWCTRQFFPGAGGSGIPQVIAALDNQLPAGKRSRFVSLPLSLAKIFLASLGLLGGLSIGREGPSVQVAAGVMQHAQRWLRPGSALTVHGLLVAGGAAGIAAAFNAPLAGVVFAIEELSRKLESRSSGLIIAGIVLAGLVAVSTFGNVTYFGRILVPTLTWAALVPGLVVALVCGALGGLFARLMTASLTGSSSDRFSRWRGQHPYRFAAAGGLTIAVIGLVTGGATFGAGSVAVHDMLKGDFEAPAFYVTLKLVATWLTAWCGVPGGIFAPSLSIGAGIGHNVASFFGGDITPALIAMGMAGFLAAVTQAPLTSFIIVMEMVDGHSMVLSLMSAAMLASLVSRMLCRPLYETLAEHMVRPFIVPPVQPNPAPPSATNDEPGTKPITPA